MYKKMLAAVLFASFSAVGTAHAIPVIDFHGVANLANVGDFYNGGTDSAGYSLGYDYGIHFDAHVALNPAGAYVKGPATMTIAPNLFGVGVAYFIEFNASINTFPDGLNSYLYNDGAMDAAYVASTVNPFCGTEASCNERGFYYTHPSQLYSYVLESDGSATTVRFNTDRLDNITIVAASDVVNPNGTRLPIIRGTADLDRDIPEPGSMALLALGATGLCLARRRAKRSA